MHFFGVGAVEVNGIIRDHFAEVGFECVAAHVQQRAELGFIPFDGVGVGEIDIRHARLPPVFLVDGAVLALQEIAVFFALFEHARRLRDIRVNPQTNHDSLSFYSLEHALGIGEFALVPGEIAPVVVFHP